MSSDWLIVAGVVVSGHGIASGRAADSPYPAGSIALQRPAFADRGLDLGAFYDGTVNVDLAPRRWRPTAPPVTLHKVAWIGSVAAETFSFLPCQLRRGPSHPVVEGLVYYPHPETKPGHAQPDSVAELLLPWVDGLQPGMAVEVALRPEHVTLF